eukprot:11382-Heterococcus_DN1.PRE.1
MREQQQQQQSQQQQRGRVTLPNARVVAAECERYVGGAAYAVVAFDSKPKWDRSFWFENTGAALFGIVAARDCDKLAPSADKLAAGVQCTIGIAFEGSVEAAVKLLCGEAGTVQRDLVMVSTNYFAYRPVLAALQGMHTVPFKRELVHSKSCTFTTNPFADDVDSDVDSDISDDVATDDTTVKQVPSYLPATIALPAVASRSGVDELRFTYSNLQTTEIELRNSKLDSSQIALDTCNANVCRDVSRVVDVIVLASRACKVTGITDEISYMLSLVCVQIQALVHALTHRVALIQGPPGTGKTYVTSLLAQIILAASSEQILFLCYTNHALDQIMEHLLDADITEIVRVGTTAIRTGLHVRTGGACTSERLEQFNLNTLERTVRYDRLDSRTHYDLKQQHEASSERIAELNRRVTSQDLPWDELCSNYYLRYCGDTAGAAGTGAAGIGTAAGAATAAAAGGLLCDPVDGLAALTVETTDADGFQLVGAGGKAIESDY